MFAPTGSEQVSRCADKAAQLSSADIDSIGGSPETRSPS
jgi:hypothetical protein